METNVFAFYKQCKLRKKRIFSGSALLIYELSYEKSHRFGINFSSKFLNTGLTINPYQMFDID